MSDGNEEFNKQEFFELFLNQEVPFNYKFLLVATVGLYTLSPIDFLPEGLLGVFGFADDVGIMVIASQLFTRFANAHLKQEHEFEQQEEQIIQEAPPANSSVYSAHSAPVQPAEPPTSATPRVIQNRQRSALPHKQQPPPPPVEQQPGDFLNDEWHEQLIEQKRQETAAQFDDVVRKKEQEKQPPQEWDFDRNNPFKKKK